MVVFSLETSADRPRVRAGVRGDGDALLAHVRPALHRHRAQAVHQLQQDLHGGHPGLHRRQVGSIQVGANQRR